MKRQAPPVIVNFFVRAIVGTGLIFLINQYLTIEIFLFLSVIT